MPMLAPWSDHEQPDGSIQVRFNDQHRFTLTGFRSGASGNCAGLAKMK